MQFCFVLGLYKRYLNQRTKSWSSSDYGHKPWVPKTQDNKYKLVFNIKEKK